MKRILSVSSGGIRGLVPLYYLLYLENDLKKLGLCDSIFDAFDMYAGTSIGSIIIGSIVYSEYKTISEIVEKLFTSENMKKMFSSTKYEKVASMIFDRPKYNGKFKESIIKEHIKKKLIDTSKDVLIPLYSIDEHKPKYFTSYKTDNTRDPNEIKMFSECDPEVYAAEIINGSSSAPNMFPPSPYKDSTGLHYNIDGAVFASTPSDVIYADCLFKYGPKTDIRILSIGTGLEPSRSLGPETESWGPFHWLIQGSIINILMENDDIASFKTQYFAKALGHTHIRIQESDINIAMDDITKEKELIETAKKWYEGTKVRVFKELFDFDF